MAGLREFVVQFGTEEQCIEHLAGLRWPGGFACASPGSEALAKTGRLPLPYQEDDFTQTDVESALPVPATT
jgi:uncharacterized protein with PIN domain